MSGVKMHSWVTMNAPCAFRMTGPETVAVVPARVMMVPPVTAIQPATASTPALS